MTTAAQVKKVVRPLLDRHADLALVGRYIYVRPVHHFARAILIDRMLDPAKSIGSFSGLRRTTPIFPRFGEDAVNGNGL